MKVMEAQEKLYVDINDNLRDSMLYGFTEKCKDDDIEYIRTDAFIEKACEWLEKNACNYEHSGGTCDSWFSASDLVESFRKYMEEQQ